MEWFKFYGGAYLSDPKMLMLTACERSCWLTLLSFASVAENNGVVKYLSEPQLMTAAGVSPMHEEWDMTVGILKKFEGLGMISLEKEGEIEVLNWGKRQESYLSNAERQRRYRENKKSNASVTTPLQQSNARIEENRIDTSVAIAPRVVEEVSDSEESTRSVKPPKYPNARTAFSWFPRTQKSWEINTTELKHGELLYERGEGQVKAMLEFVRENREEPFFSKVTKPSDLERKWLDILDWKKRNNL